MRRKLRIAGEVGIALAVTILFGGGGTFLVLAAQDVVNWPFAFVVGAIYIFVIVYAMALWEDHG